MLRPLHTWSAMHGPRSGQRPDGESVLVPDLPTPLSFTRAFIVNGRVWVIGTGARPGYSWAPGEASWRAEPQCPDANISNIQPGGPETGGMACVVGNKIFCMGGNFLNTSPRTQIFDTQTRTWSQSAPYGAGLNPLAGVVMPYHNIAPAVDGLIFLEGTDQNYNKIFMISNVTGNRIFDLPDAALQLGFPCNVPVAHETDGGVSVVMMFGGANGNQRYDGNFGAWSTFGALAPGYSTPYAEMIKTDIWNWVITGGLNNLNQGSRHTLRNDHGNFVACADMITGRYEHGMAQLPSGALLVFGGILSTLGTRTDKTEISDSTYPASWQDAGNLRSVKSDFAVTQWPNGAVMCIGGETGAGATVQVDIYVEGQGWGRTLPV